MHPPKSALLLALFSLLLLNGCIAFPIFHDKHYTNFPPGGTERPWETLKIGQTTRDDVLERFYTPLERWYADRVLVYRWRTSNAAIVLFLTDLQTTAHVTEPFDLTKDHFLLMEFDRQGTLTRFEVKHDGWPALFKNSWPSADVRCPAATAPAVLPRATPTPAAQLTAH